jgi:hypothetical protein
LIQDSPLLPGSGRNRLQGGYGRIGRLSCGTAHDKNETTAAAHREQKTPDDPYRSKHFIHSIQLMLG